MTWVKFHSELCEGAKRGLPRAVRFVYLELALKARPGRGVLDLPIGMSDLDALQDVLGGDRKEVREALRVLTAGPEPMITIDGEPGARRLCVVAWQRWNAGVSEAPGASTQRSRQHRATVAQRALHCAATDAQRSGNDRSSGDQIRVDQRREEDPPSSPSPTPPPGPSVGSGEPTKLLEVDQGPPTGPVSAVWAAYVAGWERHVGKGRAPTLDAKRRRLALSRIRELGVELVTRAAAGIWDSTWHREQAQTSFDLAMRDSAHVERFAGVLGAEVPRSASAPGMPRGAPVQPLSDAWRPLAVDDPDNPLPGPTGRRGEVVIL